MQYRKDKYGNPVSVLGYGCMRFTGTAGRIDIAKAEKELLLAYNAGVNYYDTAYIYPGSEAALGEILERSAIRDKVNIATKLPHYMLKKQGDAEKYFAEELRRLRTDRVDYYLMHMLTDLTAWQRLQSIGIEQWLAEKKQSGAIRQAGFSYHGNSDMFCRLLDVYDWDFVQIQYNYLDENTQAGVTGLKAAAAKGIPVIIMEPLRGGRLVNNLPAQAQKLFAERGEGRSPAEWAFRWLWNQPEVTCVLSGMNSEEMVRQNAAAADAAQAGVLTPDNFAMLADVVKAINSSMKVGCTGCRYCMPCPRGVDIPGTFAAYNRQYTDSKLRGLLDYFMCTAIRGEYTGAANCIGCGKCEQHCPQGIPIRAELQAAKKSLETPLFKAAKTVAPLVMKYK